MFLTGERKSIFMLVTKKKVGTIFLHAKLSHNVSYDIWHGQL